MMSDDVQSSLIELVRNWLGENAALTVTWYGGEPLLCKALITRLAKSFQEICETRKSPYHSGIVTNGVLLSKGTREFFEENNIRFCQVTIDGPKHIHDQRRPHSTGAGTFDLIIRNVDDLTQSSEISVSLRINIDRHNKDSIPLLLSQLRERGFHERNNLSLYFGHVLHYASSCKDIGNACLMTEEFAEFQVQAFRRAMELGFKIRLYPALFSETAVQSPQTRW